MQPTSSVETNLLKLLTLSLSWQLNVWLKPANDVDVDVDCKFLACKNAMIASAFLWLHSGWCEHKHIDGI